eukprot:PhF_6_TR42624/c0_g1_i1/m.64079
MEYESPSRLPQHSPFAPNHNNNPLHYSPASTASPVDYRKEVGAMRSHVQLLQDTVMQHTTQMNNVRRQLSEKVHDVDRLTLVNEDLRKQLDAVTRSYEELRNSQTTSLTQIASTNDTNRSLQAQVEVLEKHVRELQEELRDRRLELNKRVEDSSRSEWQTNELRRTLEEQRISFESMVQVCANKDETIRQRETEAHQLVLDKQALESTLSLWRDKYERCFAELNEMRVVLTTNRDKLGDLSRGSQEKELEIATLTRRLKAKEDEALDLASRSQSQSTAMGTAEELLRQHSVEIVAWKAKVLNLEAELQQARSDLRGRDAQLEVVSCEIDKLRRNITEQKNETVEYKNQVEMFEDRMKTQEKRIIDQDLEYKKELSVKAAEITRLRGVIVQLEGQCSLLRESNLDLQHVSQDYLEKHNQLQSKVLECKHEIVRKEEAMVRLTTERAELQATVQAVQDQLAASQEVVDLLRATVTRQAEEVRVKTRDLHGNQSVAQHSELESARLRSQVHELQIRVERLNYQLEDRNKELSLAHQKVQERLAKDEGLHAEITSLKSQIHMKEVEIATLREKITGQREENVKLRELPELRGRVELVTSELENTKLKLVDKTKELDSAMELRARALRTQEESESLKSRNERLEVEYMKVTQENIRLTQEADALRTTIVKLEHKLASVNIATSKVHDHAVALEEENKRLHEMLDKSRQESAQQYDYTSSLRKDSEKLSVLQGEVQTLRHQLDLVETERKQLAAENEKLHKDVVRVGEEAARSWWDSADARRKLSQSELTKSSQQRQIENLELLGTSLRTKHDAVYDRLNMERVVGGGSSLTISPRRTPGGGGVGGGALVHTPSSYHTTASVADSPARSPRTTITTSNPLDRPKSPPRLSTTFLH